MIITSNVKFTGYLCLLLIYFQGILQRQGGFSGLNDFDYQDLANLTEGRVKELQQIRTLNKIPIPNEIMENFKSM